MPSWKRWNSACLCHLAAAGLAAVWASPVKAGELSPSEWSFSGTNAGDMKKAVDNDLDTCWESGAPQATNVSVTIDLRKSVSVYRMYLNSGNERSKAPRSLNVYVGETPDTFRLVAQKKPDLQTESLFRFAPAQGRYVKLEIGAEGAGMPWAIAEMDIHAASKKPGEGKGIRVVLDGVFLQTKEGKPAAFNVLKLAAEELQYYLMELTDTPVAVVSSEEAQAGDGLRFRLVTPPTEPVPNPEPDPANLDDVSVRKEGDEILISGLTPRAVLYGVYEFLEAQGVRWLFADANGDFVPARKALDLSMLPISYRPSFSTRGLIWPGVVGMSTEQFDLFQLRHRFNMQMGMRLPIGTVPRMNCGFGWAHTMGGLFDAQEKAHPEWWPGPYKKGGCKVPCMSNPQVLEFILQKMEDTVNERIAKKLPALQGFSVHPNDSPAFCECPACEAKFGKAPRVDPDGADESNGTYDYSAHHFHLINGLAERLKKSHPELFLKTLAYANHELAPKAYEKMPGNVLIDICPWWKPLPVSAPQNAPIRDNIKAWGPKCGSIGIWSYVLIYNDTTFGHPSGEKNLVIPNLRALMDQNRFYRAVGIRQVGTQLYGPQNHWPWGVYAFAETTWKPDLKPEIVANDFFRGYYGEAWEPMLKWYELIEKVALEKNINTDEPDPRLFEGGEIVQLRAFLEQARKLAKSWVVKERIKSAAYDTEWTYEKSKWKTASQDRPYPCYRVKEAPAIDGKLDDAAWAGTPEMQGFRIAATRMNAAHPGRFAVNRPTHFRMGWDDKFLYLAMRCVDPDIEKTQEAGSKDKAFAYRNAIEIFQAPEAPPYYRQTLIDSAGNVWGPLKIKQINSHLVLTNSDFACKTAYEKDAWTLEARFPFAMLMESPPKEGMAWAANLVRPSTTAKDGEQYSSWSDIPRFHFHQYSLGAWSMINFMGQAPADVAALEKRMNAEWLKASAAHALHKTVLAAFDEKVKGKPNLSDPAVQNGAAFSGGDRDTRQFEMAWKGDPITFDSVRIRWQDRRLFKNWYTLEYWDGSQFRLIEERRDNQSEVSIHEFSPVKSNRLRLTTWDDMTGWRDMPSVKAIEVYQSK